MSEGMIDASIQAVLVSIATKKAGHIITFEIDCESDVVDKLAPGFRGYLQHVRNECYGETDGMYVGFSLSLPLQDLEVSKRQTELPMDGAGDVRDFTGVEIKTLRVTAKGTSYLAKLGVQVALNEPHVPWLYDLLQEAPFIRLTESDVVEQAPADEG